MTEEKKQIEFKRVQLNDNKVLSYIFIKLLIRFFLIREQTNFLSLRNKIEVEENN